MIDVEHAVEHGTTASPSTHASEARACEEGVRSYRCSRCSKSAGGPCLPSDWRAHRFVPGIVFCPSCATWNVGSWQ